MSCPPGEAHVWLVRLDRVLDPDRPDPASLTVLDEADHRRADLFRVSEERWRYLASHIALRHVLARYGDSSPSGLRFARDDSGRPRVENGGGLEFSLSHSGDLALIAVTTGVRIGVDVEKIRNLDHEGLAARTLTSAEGAALGLLAWEQRLPAFFRYWSCKEAYLKVGGEGLAGLPGPEFCFTGGEVTVRSSDRLEWTVVEPVVDPGYAAALAVPARPIVVRAFDWNPGESSTTARPLVTSQA